MAITIYIYIAWYSDENTQMYTKKAKFNSKFVNTTNEPNNGRWKCIFLDRKKSAERILRVGKESEGTEYWRNGMLPLNLLKPSKMNCLIEGPLAQQSQRSQRTQCTITPIYYTIL